MVELPLAGYREHEHMADWELEVWAPDFISLLEQAARGMYALAGVRLQPGLRHAYRVEVEGHDRESLLVKFLQELLYLGEMRGLAFDGFSLELDGLSLQARLQGAALLHRDKEIKAVTYHNLIVQESERGVEVHLVFDV
jgi:SHS2 domain-containing protein